MLSIRHKLDDLPLPDTEALAHSRRVMEHIHAAIQSHNGRLTFAEYMRLALYAPGLGYYSAGARKFGAAGDFVTAPELSPWFGRCLARQCAEVLAKLDGGSVLELGAGSGVMAADLLTELQRLDCLPREYLILEVSADLRQRQRELLQARVPELLPKLRWLDALPERLQGVILGNEVLDALPVRRFRVEGGEYQEFCVTDDGEGLRWELVQAPRSLHWAVSQLETTSPLPLAEGYTSELCEALAPLFGSLGAMLEKGAALFIDYGHTRAAYYHPQRSMGSLMCHYRQRAHEDPFLYPGLQDITAHVDFTSVAEAATDAGFHLAGYTTQAHFLMALGIAEAAQGGDSKAAREVKLLTLPEEMGERFKAIGFTKDMDIALTGFGLRDLSHTL
jgi:SAM-dependent MidA family methyltransferase